MLSRSQGFTLIELLVVIAVIGLLSSIVLGSLNAARDKAVAARKISDLREIEIALESYYVDHGAYPASANSCSGDWSAAFKAALAPYLAKVPVDPRNDQASCVPGNYSNYYQFDNPITWTWGSCGPGTIVLSSINGTVKHVRNDCYTTPSQTSNMIILGR